MRARASRRTREFAFLCLVANGKHGRCVRDARIAHASCEIAIHACGRVRVLGSLAPGHAAIEQLNLRLERSR